MKKIAYVLLMAVSTSVAAASERAEWEPDRPEVNYFNKALFTYRKSDSSNRTYDKDIYGQSGPRDGGIKFDFTSRTVSITGLGLQLPIDVDTKVLGQLKLVCEDLIKACDNGRKPSTTRIALGSAKCVVEYTIPDSLQTTAFLTVTHSSGESFLITKVGFVYFAIGEIERLKSETYVEFDTLAERLKAGGSTIIADGFEKKYDPKRLISAAVDKLHMLDPLIGDVLRKETLKAEAAAQTLLGTETRPLIASFQNQVALYRRDFDGRISLFSFQTLGCDAAGLIASPPGMNFSLSYESLLSKSTSIETELSRLATDCRDRIAVAARKLVEERMGRSVEQLSAEESALALKLRGIPNGKWVYSAAEQARVDLMNSMAMAMSRHEIDPSSNEVQRVFRSLVMEVSKLGRFYDNPEHVTTSGQLTKLHEAVQVRLGVKIEDLRSVLM